MKYRLKPTKFFLNQLDSLSSKALQILEDKIYLLKENPGRFKQITGFPYNLFRIRFIDCNKSKRLIYVVDGKFVKLLCILNRDKNYKDLKKYLSQIKKDNEL